MKRTCPTCKNEYDDGGDSWKKTCYQCYRDYRGYSRINPLRYKHSDVYITHPSVTKEELDGWIKKNRLETGWGAEEYEPNAIKFKIWTVYTYFD
jgi:hypothetical protein